MISPAMCISGWIHYVVHEHPAGLALLLAFFALTQIAGALVKEYESDNLRIFGSKQQVIGRKLVLE